MKFHIIILSQRVNIIRNNTYLMFTAGNSHDQMCGIDLHLTKFDTR